MKKIAALSLALCVLLALTACAAPAASDPMIAPTAATEAPDPAVAATEEPTAVPTEPPQSEYFFKDGVLVSEDVKIEITDYRVLPVGEKGNEYGEKPVIAFWYKTTNLTGNENVDPTSAWIVMFTAIQDNDPNAINELNIGMLPDDTYADSQLETIKKDGTVENAVAYELDDTTTPVTLRAFRGILGEELGEQTFEIVGK